MRSSINIEVDLEIEYVIYPPEPDVGLNHPYVGELTFYSVLTGQEINYLDVMTQAQIDNLCEGLVEGEY